MSAYPSEGGIYLKDPVTGLLTLQEDAATVFVPPCQADPPAPLAAPDQPAAAPTEEE